SAADALPVTPKRDLVEEAIQQRHKEAEERKRKILAAYDAAARSGVPGPKTADFDAINNSTSAPVTPVAKKPPTDCTFGNIIPKPAQNNQKISAKAKFSTDGRRPKQANPGQAQLQSRWWCDEERK
ncbi:smoothelin-like protein 2, partial [Trichonephila clavata]